MGSDCWRCERKNDPLVRDPMLLAFPHDRIGVCHLCAVKRIERIVRYQNGDNRFVDDGRGT